MKYQIYTQQIDCVICEKHRWQYRLQYNADERFKEHTSNSTIILLIYYTD